MGVREAGRADGATIALYSRPQLFWLYPLAAAATYYSGLLRPAQETDKRSVRGGGGMDNKGLTVKIVSEARSNHSLVALDPIDLRPFAELPHARHPELLPLLLRPPHGPFARRAALVRLRLDCRCLLLLRVRALPFFPWKRILTL